MLLKLFLLFTILPIVELVILIQVGGLIGLWPTLALVVVTGALGAFLGKREGTKAWRRVKQDMENMRMPGDSILDGLAVLIAAAFLVTPGVLSDIFGMMLLIPVARKPIKALIKGRFVKMLEGPDTQMGFFGSFPGGLHDVTDGPFTRDHVHQHDNRGIRGGDVIDITPSHEEEVVSSPEKKTQYDS